MAKKELLKRAKELSEPPEIVIKGWVSLYTDDLYSWAYRKTLNKETAEDLVQETFMSAVSAFHKFEGKSSPKTWLFAILNHKINDHYRKSYADPVTPYPGLLDKLFNTHGQWKPGEKPQDWGQAAETHVLDDPEFQDTLNHCLQKLPAKWLSAIQLKYYEEKNGALICQELNISNTNFWQMLHRAKLQLRKCLEVNWFKK